MTNLRSSGFPDSARLLLALAATLALFSLIRCDRAEAQELTWKSKAGTSVTGELVAISDDKIILKLGERAAPVQVPAEQLAAPSQYQAYELWFNRQDAKQFQMIRQHLQGMTERPGAVSRLLLEIHKAVPESPYAGIWAAAGVSEGENDNSFAMRLLQQSIDRIEKQREILTTRHGITLASAHNNLGVVSMKERGANQAAASFIAAVESSTVVSPIIEHNAQLIAQADSQEVAKFQLSPRLRSDLLSTLAAASMNTTKPNLQDNLYYMLDFDLPLEAGAASRKIDGLESPSVFMELASIGTGFVVAPGIVLTSQKLLNEDESLAGKLITVGSSDSGQFKSLKCKSCLLTSPYTRAVRSTAFHSNRSPIVSFMTDFRVIHPQAGSTSDSLMALHIPGLDAAPLAIADETPTTSTNLALHGYEPGQQMIERGLQVYPGSVTSNPSPHGIQKISNTTTNGNRGGPLLDGKNLVHGIAFDLPTNALDSGGEAYGARAIRSWFNRHVRTTSLVNPETLAPGDSPVLNESIVPVFIWQRRDSGGLFSAIADGSGPSESLILKNTWCVFCAGQAFRDCPNCTQGVQSYKERDVVARTELAGNIYGTVVKKKKCSTCRGSGRLKCRVCKNGRVD